MSAIVQGVRVNVRAAGRGVPTLFIHGNPDSSIVWHEVIARMDESLRCLAPDLPGFGHSASRPTAALSLDGLADWVRDLLDALEVREPVNLVVHDIGGPWGLSFLVKYPDRVRRLAILNSVYHGSYRWHPIGRILRTPVLGELLMAINSRRLARREMRRGSPTLSNAQIDAAFDLATPAMKRAVLELYRFLDPGRLRGHWEERLRELIGTRVPALVLWGDRDPYVGREFADRFGAQQVRHFPQWGHWLMLESPAEVAAELNAFFAAGAQSGGHAA